MTSKPRKGRPSSIQNVALVIGYPVPPKKRNVFLLERPVSMMFFLVEDIPGHLFDGRYAYRKGAVSRLPCEMGELRKRLVDPFRGNGLQRAHHLRDRCRGVQLDQQMNVIVGAAGGEQMSAVVLCDPAEVFEQ